MGIKRGLRTGLPECGKIKIGMVGEKTSSGRRKAIKLRYFRITKTHKGPDGNFILDTEMHKLYGDKPIELECTVPFDDIDKVCPTEYCMYVNYKEGKGDKAYTVSKKECYGDGIVATRLKSDGTTNEVPCDPEKCPYMLQLKGNKHICKPSCRLHVMLSKAPRLGALHVLRSHGWNTVSNFIASLEEIKTKTGAGDIEKGILRGIPLRLTLLAKNSQQFGTVIHVNIEAQGNDWTEVVQHSIKELTDRNRNKVDIRMIEASADSIIADTDDPNDVINEFYSDGAKEVLQEGTAEEAATLILGAEPYTGVAASGKVDTAPVLTVLPTEKESLLHMVKNVAPDVTMANAVQCGSTQANDAVAEAAIEAALQEEGDKIIVTAKPIPEDVKAKMKADRAAAEREFEKKQAKEAAKAKRAETIRLKKENEKWAADQKKDSEKPVEAPKKTETAKAQSFAEKQKAAKIAAGLPVEDELVDNRTPEEAAMDVTEGDSF